jgi:hypothetical protein
MFKRVMLALTFIAAFSTAGIGLSNRADAWRGGWGWGRPYASYYYGPRVAYYGPRVVPYRAYYAPRIVRPYYAYYPGSYYYSYPAYADYYYGPPAGVSVSVGY